MFVISRIRPVRGLSRCGLGGSPLDCTGILLLVMGAVYASTE
jgi:hypothetical protein